MRIRNVGRHGRQVDQMMTPLIDVVFLLLVFFVLTFKVIAPEGDFDVKMPRAAPGPPTGPAESLPITVRLFAGNDGRLVGVKMNERSLAGLGELHLHLRQLVADDRGPAAGPEVEFDCDYNLRYEHMIEAVTAVSGYLADDGKRLVKLIDKIRFRPPRAP